MAFLRPLGLRLTIGLTVPTLYVSHQILFPRRSYILQCQTTPYLTDRILEASQDDQRFKFKRRHIEEDGTEKRGTPIFDAAQYRQLSLGSFSGVMVGYVIGRLSKMIAFVSLLVILMVQYMERHGYHVLPRQYRIRKFLEETDIKPLLTENAAFKYSFASTFAISAWFAN
ncbi:hypothetical protein TWF569_011276 [Orbilia oligospora]|uniref:Uncharacterized protein n=1 Tax=Orbilia oligospora TaxID=2813651 RepID=A0A7C8J7R0_ORBOL|nr:hypothetical protein TWF103_002670 [Orbilia oligospora]KAF3091512.1 hypothetical protein TWF102_008797 [Orbilia oligospora]KAF3094324.1 hypothetical protein TWF706_008546 [Orbilia oligospora]KAF3128489.1 hypothetical protein TWF703_009559 [Orbilia oligospora]KAF3132884.1 hypothetical protein TWF594_009400 [Orbilia oligospora]